MLANRDFGRTPITEITAPMILKTLRKVEAKGNYETAHRLRARIGSIFRYAVASVVAETDPTHALRDALIRPARQHRAAITDPSAFGALLREIKIFDGQTTTRIALQLLALSAQRPGELRHAKWSEFDETERVWAIPAGKMKMRRDHLVSLAEQSLNLLEELRPLTGESEYLFPSLRSWHRLMSENTMNAALRRMGYSGDEMTAHGFRVTFSTSTRKSVEGWKTKFEPSYLNVQIVRRQGFWDRWRCDVREGLAHLVYVIMRRICGEASAGFRWSSV